MVEQKNTLTRAGIYLAKLDPVKGSEVGKIRPVILLNAQVILDVTPPVVFVCPLSSQSQPAFSSIHIQLPPRDNLQIKSYALVEHCRTISVTRLIHPRIAQITQNELSSILENLKIWLDC